MTQSAQPSRVRRWLSAPIAIVVIGATLLIPATSVSAADPTDMVLEWNVNAINAIGNANAATPPGLAQVPPLAGLHLAMVHGAIYDAVNAIDGTHEPYLDPIHAPPGDAPAGHRQPRHALGNLVWGRSPTARPRPMGLPLAPLPQRRCSRTARAMAGPGPECSRSESRPASGAPCHR